MLDRCVGCRITFIILVGLCFVHMSLSFLFRGLMPADADYNLLDVARRLEMYGITLYPAKVRD